MIALTMLGEPVVIYRKSNGEAVALENRCVHRLAPLSLGRVEGDNLRCMYHGMLFSDQGKALEIPGQDLIPERACIRSYPVVEISGWLEAPRVFRRQFSFGYAAISRRSEEHTSELQSLMRISYAVLCLKKKKTT